MPLRMQVNDEADWTGAAAWAVGCVVVLWGEPLQHWIGPSLLRRCDSCSVERQLPFALLAPLHIKGGSQSSRRCILALRLQLVNPTLDNVSLSLPVRKVTGRPGTCCDVQDARLHERKVHCWRAADEDAQGGVLEAGLNLLTRLSFRLDWLW